MTSTVALLNCLADGRFHSGETLAAQLGVTRAAIWKRLKKIEAMGLSVDAVRGRGYRLQQPLELLNTDMIRDGLPAHINDSLGGLDLFDTIDSTNRYLMKTDLKVAGAHICLAEMQLEGRGRRGRPWVSPFASNLYCSIKWHYDTAPATLSGLSLALGVGLMRVLSAASCEGVGLKWPNDIYCNDKKMAGILLELSGDVNGPCQVVAGVGVNVRMPSAIEAIDQPWTDLYSILGERTPGRNRLVAGLISEWIEILSAYTEQGFEHYRQEWNSGDITNGRMVTLSAMDFEKQGIAQGVNEEGALLLETDKGIEVCHAGEVSLRIKV